MIVRRRRTLPASPEALWDTIGDPYHLPRWWPRVERVELVKGDGFTELLRTGKGRAVRADFRVVASERPQLRRWRQELAGSPFESILVSAETEVRLEPDGDGTRVTLIQEQRLKGMTRLGGYMVRRAARRALDGALDGLEAIHGA